MKTYLDETGFRLIGKAWEIRHKLRAMSAAADKETGSPSTEGSHTRNPHGMTVAAYLNGTPPRETTRR